MYFRALKHSVTQRWSFILEHDKTTTKIDACACPIDVCNHAQANQWINIVIEFFFKFANHYHEQK